MMLQTQTVSETLWDSLLILMQLELLNDFRLVGGTSLSLQLGHRMSLDIDLFTALPYDSIDFNTIDTLINATFPHVEEGFGGNNSMGKTYYIGRSADDLVKLDLFYTDPFVYPEINADSIRLAGLEEIAAMKLEVVGNGGRKKDFWDLHELLDHYSLSEMLVFHQKRFPYSHTRHQLVSMLANFNSADEDLNPICLRNKYWELIKLDFEERVQKEFYG